MTFMLLGSQLAPKIRVVFDLGQSLCRTHAPRISSPPRWIAGERIKVSGPLCISEISNLKSPSPAPQLYRA